jgi:hypothetical protein
LLGEALRIARGERRRKILLALVRPLLAGDRACFPRLVIALGIVIGQPQGRRDCARGKLLAL